jgi:hypothetical protein
MYKIEKKIIYYNLLTYNKNKVNNKIKCNENRQGLFKAVPVNKVLVKLHKFLNNYFKVVMVSVIG